MQCHKKQEFKKNTAMYGRGSFTEEEKEEHTILSNSNIFCLNHILFKVHTNEVNRRTILTDTHTHLDRQMIM